MMRLIYSFLLIVLGCAIHSVYGFAPFLSSHPTASRTASRYRTTQHRALTIALDYASDSSEWYSPPPPAPATLTQKINTKASQTPLASMDDFHSFLINAGQHELVLIKFHASWCRSCAKFGRKLDQLAAQYEQSGDGKHLKIGTVEYMEGRKICQALEIEALPTIHLYYRNHDDGTMQKVQDFSCPPSAFSQVQDFVKYYVDRSKCLSVDEEEQRFAKVLDQGRAMIQTSLEETKKAGKLRSGWKRLLGGGRRRVNDE